MPSTNIRRSRYLDDAEINFLRYSLAIDRPPVTIKRALQTLCQEYERERRLYDANEIRQALHGHIGSSTIVVRRWALKALGLIGHPDDTYRIIDRMKVEEDFEAQSWGMAALLGNAKDRTLKDLCAEAKLDKSAPLILAARLYASPKWIENYGEDIRISVDDDDLTLKWATFLIGYNKAPEDLFNPRFKNDIFLGELNGHQSPDISEYSMWALWERDDFDASRLTVGLKDAAKLAESARKWLYRLATQSPNFVNLDADAFTELREDRSIPAREGLAYGVADLNPEVFGDVVLDWYDREPDPGVKTAIVTSMTRQAHDLNYQDCVTKRFVNEPVDSEIRKRLLASSVGTPVWPMLQKITSEQNMSRQGLFQFSGTQNTFIIGDRNMTGSTFNSGGDINAQNIVGGNMTDSANNAIQNMDVKNSDVKDVLEKVMQMIRETDGTDESKDQISAAVVEMAKAPSEAAKKSLVSNLGAYVKGLGLIGSSALGIEKIIALVQHIKL